MPVLHELLSAQAERDEAGIAALCQGGTLTFGQAEVCADRIAAGLAARGIRQGSRVGLHLTRSLHLMPALVGLLRAGGVCVPVDPEDPAERRTVILEFARTELVLTERALLDAPYPHGTVVVAVEDLLEEKADFEPVAVRGDALAFVFYTSGSTGVPKGVMLSHEALVSGQRWLQDTFDLKPGERHLLRTTLSITNLVREVFWPLVHGGTAVIVPPGEHKDPDRLVEIVNAAGVCNLLVVPALIAGMLQNPAFAANTSLRYVFCSSDVMPGALAEEFFASGPGARLFNMYGLTEALYASNFECLPGVTYEGFVPIGHAAELTPVILDDTLRPVPDGQTGELCLTGTGMASGYDRLPELTAAKFPRTTAGRTFRTGDLARRTADGGFELHGRMDDQVKVSGYRVELGEVEARLKTFPGVTGAVVSGRRGAGGHQRLIAHLTCAGAVPAAADLRAHVARHLPAYMVPAAFVIVDAIPLTHNGKVDRRALAGQDGHLIHLAETHQEPRTDLERYLCGLWADVLDLAQVGIHDDFLALGGDSIQGFLIAAKANAEGLGLSSTQFFATPTVAETAALVESRRRALGDGRAVAAVEPVVPYGALAAVRRHAADPDGITKLFPLTDMQKGMLFHCQLDPDAGVYVEQLLYTLDGDLDVDAFHRAWQHVARRHEILRTWIATRGLDDPLHAVQQDVEPQWTVLDWAGHDGAAQDAMLGRWLDADQRRGFDLEQAPLFRLALIRTGAARYRFVMTYHHLVLDIWSLFVLLRDAVELYRADREDTAPALPAPRPYSDYVAFVLQQDTTDSRAYWTERLAGFKGPTVIGRTARPDLSASDRELHAGATYGFGPEATSSLLAYGRDQRLTVNSMIQASWATVLAALTDSDDVCFGTTITHRPVALSGIEDMAGIFVNILPLRLSLDPARPLAGWLRHVQDTQLEAHSHEKYPLPLIQQHPDLPSGHLLFESLLVFENIPHGIGWAGNGGLTVEQGPNRGWTNYPLTIGVSAQDELLFRVEYDRAHFDRDTVDRAMRSFLAVLHSIADGTPRSLGALLNGIAPARHPDPADRTPTTAATPDEIDLARIWTSVLGTGDLDVHTSFLDLGGSSLAALRVRTLAQEKGFTFTLRDLFSADGTLHRLATGRAR
ncbi:condensation domain-containing protein [Streptomyces lavendulae]|uniref:condensation domain-containing protein n=1 Tax=Streptomyces lavendulae TaxID=1914 RepID=UPI0024A19547|nr:condensation domain-containing protein [Streptomyces lavendulae]GLX17077.1 non-ribosomal peptide synthetase [Streptomyces lavendulae subsp. lavendulae]GLX29584.1 non-ribosomal peptide synthetase [Streptomyces lavendulae subsp. lavendulae]